MAACPDRGEEVAEEEDAVAVVRPEEVRPEEDVEDTSRAVTLEAATVATSQTKGKLEYGKMA
jgi:hypothetical protein